MPNWVTLATLDKLPPGRSIEVEHAGRIYALYNIGGTLHAVDGICPHQGGPLADGELSGTVVTCPWHGWKFDVRTGQCLTGSRVVQPVYEVKTEGNNVMVAVP